MWLSLLSLWSWEEVPVAPAGADPAAAAGAALDLLVRLLGAADDRRALGRLGAAPDDAPCRSAIDELRTGARRQRADRRVGTRSSRCSTAASTATSAARSRRCAAARCATAERWIVERQERDGSWGGIQPPWVWSIVALHALGYPLDHPVLARALAGLDTFTIEDDGGPPDRGVPVAGLGHGARA